MSQTTISIVDPSDRIVATTGSYAFQQTLTLGSARDGPHIETDDRKVIAHATAEPYHGFDGLRLRCIIEHVLPDAAEVEAALRGD